MATDARVVGHTAGPWRADVLPDGAVHVGNQAGTIGIRSMCDGDEPADSLPDARLIAAAPEPLEALEDINDCLVKAANGANDLYDKNPDEFLDDLIDMASEAIRKAKGGRS